MADIFVVNMGSLVGFQLIGDAAKAWVAENLPDDTQSLGNIVYVEHRYASAIFDGMQESGLNIT